MTYTREQLEAAERAGNFEVIWDAAAKTGVDTMGVMIEAILDLQERQEHTEDCAAEGFGADCAPVEGQWDQPPRVYVDMAHQQLGEYAPWCQIRIRALGIMDQEGR